MLFNKACRKLKLDLPIAYSTAHWTIRRQARLQYIELQDGICWFCKEKLDSLPSKEVRDTSIDMSLFPEGMFSNPIHLHHNHMTDMTIGAVHARCNAVLWQYHGE